MICNTYNKDKLRCNNYIVLCGNSMKVVKLCNCIAAYSTFVSRFVRACILVIIMFLQQSLSSV